MVRCSGEKYYPDEAKEAGGNCSGDDFHDSVRDSGLVLHMFASTVAGATKEPLIQELIFMLYMHMFSTFHFVVVAVFYVACKAFHADTSEGPSGFYPISKYTALPSNIT